MPITRLIMVVLLSTFMLSTGNYWVGEPSVTPAEASSKKTNRTSNFNSSSKTATTKKSVRKSTKRSAKKSSRKSSKSASKSHGVPPSKHATEGEALSCNAALAKRAIKNCQSKDGDFAGRRNCVSSALDKFAQNTRRLRSVLPSKSPAKISQIVKLASSVRKAKTKEDATSLLTQAKDAFLATLELAQEEDKDGKKELEVNLDEINGVFDTALSAMETAT